MAYKQRAPLWHPLDPTAEVAVTPWVLPAAAVALRPPLELTTRERAIVEFLRGHPGSRMAEIARHLGIAYQTAGAAIDRLRAHGIVTREHRERAYVFSLSNLMED